MKALYFAWVRERIGHGEEYIQPPPQLVTIADLIEWLSAKGEGYAYAFENPEIIRSALDRTHVPHHTAFKGAREIAFFPPMTGG